MIATHPVITTKPYCGDCGQTRTDQCCPSCLYPVCSACAGRHDG